MWPALGLALALFTASFSWWRSRGGSRSYYASDVYGMTATTHLRYAFVSLLFALAFTLGLFLRGVPAVPLLAAYVVVVVFYFSSFVRGYSDEE
jgi:hypothetical protein